jgi:hypothetical protein
LSFDFCASHCITIFPYANKYVDKEKLNTTDTTPAKERQGMGHYGKHQEKDTKHDGHEGTQRKRLLALAGNQRLSSATGTGTGATGASTGAGA